MACRQSIPIYFDGVTWPKLLLKQIKGEPLNSTGTCPVAELIEPYLYEVTGILPLNRNSESEANLHLGKDPSRRVPPLASIHHFQLKGKSIAA